MKRVISCFAVLIFIHQFAIAQNAENNADTPSKSKGNLWGMVFGDYAYKVHDDSLNRGTGNPYQGMKKDMNLFQLRRVYVGYKYDINERFSTEVLLAAEDDNSGGDLLTSGKFSPFIKLANIRWKNIFPGSDLVAGEMYTPAISMIPETIWGYRSIEKMQDDIYKTPAYDLGVSLQGHLPNNDNYGYQIMEGNGQGAKPENNGFKRFYGEVYGKFYDKKLIIDFYTDYEKLRWAGTWHSDRMMNKLFIAYTTDKFTLGAEAFYTRFMGDVIATRRDGVTIDTITTKSVAFSCFVKGKIYNETLGFFARYDKFTAGLNNDNSIYKIYSPQTAAYDPNTGQQFVTIGIDYSPLKNIHIIPNLWYANYTNLGPQRYNSHANDYDLVFRLTVWYSFGK